MFIPTKERLTKNLSLNIILLLRLSPKFYFKIVETYFKAQLVRLPTTLNENVNKKFDSGKKFELWGQCFKTFLDVTNHFMKMICHIQ